MINLVVEGWRFIPHSYAIVNQYQLLEFIEMDGVNVFHNDQPYFKKDWRQVFNLLPVQQEQQLGKIPSRIVEKDDVVFRIICPYDVLSEKAQRTLVFMTSEWGIVEPNDISGSLSNLSDNVKIITPSNWSKQGIIRSGACERDVFVVGHGVDNNVFKPVLDQKQKNLLRCKYKINSDFVFYNSGAMTGNKGLIFLLKAFAQVAMRYENAMLLLKGLDVFYGSIKMLDKLMNSLSIEERKTIEKRIRYIGGTLAQNQLVELYQLSDAYVSPYLAEGFNLPVLEAMACGLPVICTAGGATDDFTNSDTCWKIKSRLDYLQGKNGLKYYFQRPDIQNLIELMMAMIDNSRFQKCAAQHGPLLIRKKYLWKDSVEKIISVMVSN